MVPNHQLLIPVATLWSRLLLDSPVIRDVVFSPTISLLLHPPRCPSAMVWRLWRGRVMRKRRRMTWVWTASLRGQRSVWRKGRVSRAPVSPRLDVRHLSRAQTKRARELRLSLDSACSTALQAYLRPHPSIRLWVTPDPNSLTTTPTSRHLRTAVAPVHVDAGHGHFPLGIFIFLFPLAQQTSSPGTQGGQGWDSLWQNLRQGPQIWQWVKMWAGAEMAYPSMVLVQCRRPSVPFVPPVPRNFGIICFQGFAGAATHWTASCGAPIPEQNMWTAARRGFLVSWLELHGCLPAGALLQPL